MSRILKFLLVIIFILSLSCTINTGQSGKSYDLGVPRYDPIVQVKIDEAFNEKQKALIAKAFRDWERASNYKVYFKLIWDQPKPGPYWKYAKPEEGSGLFFWYLPKTKDFISNDEIARWSGFVGLMVYGKGEKSGNIIIFDNVSQYNFYNVALHEIGHLLGLKHIESHPVVMHPAALGDCISQADVDQLCQLYGCVPVSQCAADHYEDQFNLAIRTSSSVISFPVSSEIPPMYSEPQY